MKTPWLAGSHLWCMILTACIVLFGDGGISFGQTNSNSSIPANIPPFEATGLMMNALQYGGTTEDVKALLDKGANPNAKNADGWPALQLAARQNKMEIVRLLLDKGADVNTTNMDGVTSLGSVAFRGYLDIAKLLVEKGADVNVKFSENATALYNAARGGYPDVAALLLDHGADINSTITGGYTSLIEAAEDGKVDVVKLLLARGADVNKETELGFSALDKASYKGNTVIVQLLQQAGAAKSSNEKMQEDLTNKMQSLSNSMQTYDSAWQSFSNSVQAYETVPSSLSNLLKYGTTDPPATAIPNTPPSWIGKFTDSDGNVTNDSVLTPFTVTNSAGEVFTDAVLVKLMPNKCIYKTPGGAMGTMRLELLPETLKRKIGFDPVAAEVAADAERQAKMLERQRAQQRTLDAELAQLNAQSQPNAAGVSQSIRAYAERKWPGQYDMQKYEIDLQTQSYNWVAEKTFATGIPQSIFDQIKADAINKWPDEYDMQKYEIQTQVKSYLEIH